MKPINVLAAFCGAALLLGSCEEKTPVDGVVLDSEEISLVPAETHQLTATVSPEDADYDAVIWLSTDEKVATVSESGLVTAVSKGEADIVAHVGKFSAICKVKVTVPAEGISLDRTELALAVGGEAVKLTAAVSPENADYDAVAWSSSDAAVATVSATGLVTPVAKGEAVIAAEVSGFKAECKVVVTVPVQSVTLDKATLELNEGGAAAQLTATVNPADADYDAVAWTSADASVATVSESGLVTPVAQGETTVTVEVAGFKAECKVTVAPPAKTWEIGDYYEVDGVKGVVVWVSDSKTSGKIVSLDEAVQNKWASGSYNTGATSEDDGKANTEKIKEINESFSAFPAFKWCVDHGTGWYMPALSEVYLFLKAKSVIDPVLTANGGTAITNYYWSSTEASEDETAALYGYLNYKGVPASYSDFKDNPEDDMMVRAMYQF